MSDLVKSRIRKLLGLPTSEDDSKKESSGELENVEKSENLISKVQGEAFNNQVNILKSFEQMAANYLNSERGETSPYSSPYERGETSSPFRGASRYDEAWVPKKEEVNKLPTEFGQRKIRINGDQGS